ncbi:hypothetical protein WMY93_025172 [Mugilogobius chulae]|uniref:Uncharacterized protein n=1 Tax=Mugilogobius chulae TaxID=88201 RepID=A0AAW0NBN1_9GOBI
MLPPAVCGALALTCPSSSSSVLRGETVGLDWTWECVVYLRLNRTAVCLLKGPIDRPEAWAFPALLLLTLLTVHWGPPCQQLPISINKWAFRQTLDQQVVEVVPEAALPELCECEDHLSAQLLSVCRLSAGQT